MYVSVHLRVRKMDKDWAKGCEASQKQRKVAQSV